MAKSNTAAVTKANKLAAAREEVKQIRARRKAEKKAVEEHIAAVQPEPVAASVEDMIADIQLPSARRVMVGIVLSAFAAFGTGYGIGIILSYILAGITLFFGAGLIAFILQALAWIAAVIGAWKAGGWVAGKVFSAVVLPEGLASQSFASVSGAASDAKARVAGWFKTKSVEPFTGAHVA